jgi:hypothetical protein
MDELGKTRVSPVMRKGIVKVEGLELAVIISGPRPVYLRWKRQFCHVTNQMEAG